MREWSPPGGCPEPMSARHFAATASLVRLGLRELWRTRWPGLLLLSLLASGLLAAFGASLAVTESAAIRMVLQAALTRWLVIATFSLLVIANTVRESEEGVLELLLSRPVTRGQRWFGRFIACSLAAGASAALAAVPLWVAGAAPVPVFYWAGSFACELLIIGAAALAMACSLRHVTLAFAGVLGFYVLSRALQGLVALSADDLIPAASGFDSALRSALRILALILPDLDRFTRSEWLVGTPPEAGLCTYIALQTLCTVAVLGLIGLVDSGPRRGW